MYARYARTFCVAAPQPESTTMPRTSSPRAIAEDQRVNDPSRRSILPRNSAARMLAAMALVPAWIVRVHVRAGSLGAYAEVEHLSFGLERFVAPGDATGTRVPVVTLATYLCGATRADVEELARAIAAAHPWEHPLIRCDGPEGSFVWMPDA
jgi:hypothetical protein